MIIRRPDEAYLSDVESCRHAYLLLVHTNPLQARILIHLLDHPRHDIYVHIDRKASFGPEALEGVCRQSRVVFVRKPVAVRWGGVSMMKAELLLLKESLKGHYAYYHLLSGMDLPIKDNNFILSFFDDNPGREFIMMWKEREGARERVIYPRIFPEGNRFFLTSWLNRIGQKFCKAFGIRINTDIDIRFASQWFSIEDDFAHYVVSREKWLMEVFSHSNICDEIFIPTLLAASPFYDRIYDGTQYEESTDIHNMASLRFIDWKNSANGRHPYTFRIGDYDRIVKQPHFWARKFDVRADSEIIDKIAGR